MKAVYMAGMALNCALGDSRSACVSALRAGEIALTDVALDMFEEPLALRYFRIADGADLLDPERMQRLLPPVLEEALAHAGIEASQRRNLPLFIGSSCFSIRIEEQRYAQELAQDPTHALAMSQAGFDGVAALVRNVTGSHGPAFTCNTACTSAANALLAAQRAIAIGRYPAALVVGVELASLTTLSGFSALQLLADDLKPFDAARAGTVLGEGISAVVLRAKPGARSLPRITAGASQCDTHGVTGANPDGSSVAAIMERVLQATGIRASAIRTLKAHATGTPSNDAAEARGMHRVFAKLPPVCALKGWLGHTLGASGLNELVLFASALEQGFVPAGAGFESVDDDLNVSPLQSERPAQCGHYLLNQFGFGGNNTVLMLEQPC